MRILLTGSSGFVGQNFLRELSGQGDLMLFTRKTPLQEVHDFKPDYIFHVAGEVYNKDEMFDSNVGLTYKLLDAVFEYPYQSFVYVSTSSVLLETQTAYSRTKRLAEEICDANLRLGKPILVARPFSLYGAMEPDFRFIPTVCNSLIKNKKMKLVEEPTHDWLYVEDFVRGIISLAGRQAKGLIHMGTGVKTTNLEVVRMLQEIAGRELDYEKVDRMRDYDNDQWVCHTRSAMEYYSWRSTTELKEGLKKTYQYYLTEAAKWKTPI